MREQEAIGLRERAAQITRWLNGVVHASMDWTGVWLSLLPGLGHIRAGHRRLGFTVMGIWFALILLMLVFAGGSTEWFLYVMVVGLHCSIVSLLFVVPLQTATLLRRLLTGLVICGVLNLLVYFPARWLANRFVVAAEVNGFIETPLLTNGDAIVYTGPWLSPETWQRGDLLIYRTRPIARGGVAVNAGVAIDRVIATQGEVVTVAQRTLFVNGVAVPSAMLPINGIASLDDGFKLIVEPGGYFILPSALALTWHGRNVDELRRSLIRQASVVKGDQILGQVRWRLRPWSRFGTLPVPAAKPTMTTAPDISKAKP